MAAATDAPAPAAAGASAGPVVALSPSSTSSSPSLSSPTAAASAYSSSVNSGRLLIVANRLPVSMSIKQPAGGGRAEISFSSSAGGLVSALAGTDMESFWIGWPGGEVKSKEDRGVVVDKLKALGSIPVFLAADVCDLFYNGFCNDLLWPLFHYIPLPLDAIKAHDKQFKAYQKANAEFAKVVLEHYQDGDVVWVHDYHLMLLPSLLRQARPQMKIGFFFHTPFPSSEIYRVIPSRDELLYGVLSANLLGFHTHDYSRHFQSAATRIIGAQCSNEQITLHGAISSLGTFPIGIDPKRFVDALATEKVQSHMEEFRRQFAGKRVLLGHRPAGLHQGHRAQAARAGAVLRAQPQLRGRGGAGADRHPVAHGCGGVPAPAHVDARAGRTHQRTLRLSGVGAHPLPRPVHPLRSHVRTVPHSRRHGHHQHQRRNEPRGVRAHRTPHTSTVALTPTQPHLAITCDATCHLTPPPTRLHTPH